MTRWALPLLLVGSLGLGGCVASIAASALGAAVNAARSGEVINEDLGAPAVAACTAKAAAYGSVHVIDTERHRNGRVTVWGSVRDDRERRSFECRYNGKVTAFKLRSIRTKSPSAAAPTSPQPPEQREESAPAAI